MNFNDLKQQYAKPLNIPVEIVAPRRIILNRGSMGNVGNVDYGKREPNYMTRKVSELERAAKNLGGE
jgi:hypothetical protein